MVETTRTRKRPGGGRRERTRRIGDSTRPDSVISKTPISVGRAEPILGGADNPVLLEPFALKVEDCVHHVFEGSGPATAPDLVTWPTMNVVTAPT